jgi:hypothetical protein
MRMQVHVGGRGHSLIIGEIRSAERLLAEKDPHVRERIRRRVTNKAHTQQGLLGASQVTWPHPEVNIADRACRGDRVSSNRDRHPLQQAEGYTFTIECIRQQAHRGRLLDIERLVDAVSILEPIMPRWREDR